MYLHNYSPSFLKRTYDKIFRLSRTITDLAGEENIASPHVAEAMQYRAWWQVKTALNTTQNPGGMIIAVDRFLFRT
ncbi:MAG: hypothetical protein KC897_07655 [Candidatus Omnitrophica bacterium]|nr:hypothetical protein [Candidatus Omnitrophota bacterium]MCB9720489.1 hypothetical protein [Candidatus Omnitrophota bacterium]